ncbi:MAG: (Fe-S)-binding protein [Acidobacteria bacterium]|nr:(Fe-S)-binding protein [Acidobacteriota bacterium]
MSVSAPTVANSLPSRADLTPECIHCGLCLQACPTYIELGKEADSPRGRIYLMRAQQRGAMPVSESFVQHISACLDCRGCESACPSGVPYGELVEKAREVIEHSARRSFWVEWFRAFVFRKMFPSRRLLRLNFDMLRWYQRSGVQRLVRGIGVLKLFPGHLAELEQLLPDIRSKNEHVALGTVFPAQGGKRFRVAVMTGCVMNEIFGDVNQATIRVLQQNGCDVVVPEEQVCCGALHCHAGIMDTARDLAKKNIVAFEQAEIDAVISNASGCGAKLKEYGMLLAGDREFAERAVYFSQKVKDIASFLDALPSLAKPGELRLRVAYDDPCHLLHAMKVSRPPRNVLRGIPGLELVELSTPEQCCGSAGIYNITNYELSMRILRRKIDDIRGTGADVVATGNPGCMLQIAHGLRQAGLDQMKVMHPVELLDQAYRCGQ